MSIDDVRQEAILRLDRAKSALERAGPAVAPIIGYVDLLIDRGAIA